MIKASALKPLASDYKNTVADVLTKRSQDIIIEYSQSSDLVPHAVETLACEMLQLDADVRDLLNNLRVLYVSKRENFHLSMRGLSKEAKTRIIDLFKCMYGVVAEVHYCADCDVINGKLIHSPKAQMFITGQYMEIAIRKIVSDVLSEIEKKHRKQFKLYANTKVTTVDGKLKNEFDLIVENVSDTIIYVIEIKSGKNFRDFDKLMRIGREYGIVPNRLLLIGNYLTTSQVETIEYFCEYYCTNLEQDNLKQKLITMIENDLEMRRDSYDPPIHQVT